MLIKEPRGAVGHRVHRVHSTSGQTQPTAASVTQRAGYRANYQVLGTTEEFVYEVGAMCNSIRRVRAVASQSRGYQWGAL